MKPTYANQLLDSRPMRLVGLGLLLAALSACGSQVTPRATYGYSGGGPTTTTPIVNGAGDAMTECTSFDTTSTRLQGKVTTYYYNNILQEDQVRMRISAIPDLFTTKPGVYIQMFRWRVETVNNVETAVLDSTNPILFNIESGNGSVSPIASDLKTINLNDVTNLRRNNSIPGSTATDFFANTTLVLKGVNYDWSAVKIVVYDDKTVVGQADLLLPVFQANPNRYAATHSAILSQLHPFWLQKTQNLPETEWSNRGRGLCF